MLVRRQYSAWLLGCCRRGLGVLNVDIVDVAAELVLRIAFA